MQSEQPAVLISRNCNRYPLPALAALILLTCTAQYSVAATWQPPDIKRIEPETIRFGKQVQVDITLSPQAQAHSQVPLQAFLSPGGPFVTDFPKILKKVSGTVTSSVYLDGSLLLLTTNGMLYRLDRSGATASGSNKIHSGKASLLGSQGRAFAYTSDGSLFLIDKDSLAINKVLELDSPVSHLGVTNGHLYTLGENGNISIYAFMDGKPARLLHQLHRPASALTVHAGQVYLAGDDGIWQLHKSTGEDWTTTRLFITSGRPRDLVAGAGLLYVADGEKGVTILGTGNGPANDKTMRFVGSLNKLGNVQTVSLGQYRLLAATDDKRLHFIDTSDPARPVLLSSIRLDKHISNIKLVDELALVQHADQTIVVDMGSETMPPVSTVGVTLGGSRRGQAQGNLLYVADWFSGLHIYDISNPADIRHLSNFHTDGSSKGVLVHNGYAFVGDDDHGLQIIDVRNPQKPERVAQLPTTGLAYTMKLDGELLYLADHSGGLHIIDVSDVSRPRRVAVYDTPGKAWAVDLHRQHAYVADDNNGLLVFDVSDPANPVLAGQYAPGGFAEDIKIRDSLAYVAFFDMGLHILDISTPHAPTLVSRIDIPGNARGIEFVDDHALISAWYAGLQIVDIKDPAKPTIIGHYDTDGATWGTVRHGDHVYALDWWDGIKAIDISNPLQPQRVSRYQARETIQDLSVKGNYIFTSNHNSGLQVHDIRNPLNPMWVTGLELPGNSGKLAIAGELALVEMEKDIAVIDITNPFKPGLLTTLTSAGSIAGVSADGGILLANRDDSLTPHLTLYRPDDRQQLAATGTIQTPDCRYFIVHRQRLACANAQQQAYLYQLYNHGAVLQKKIDLSVSPDLLRINDNYLVFYSSLTGDLQIINNRPPYSTLLKTTIEAGISDLAISGDTLYTTRGEHGLQAYRISESGLLAGAQYHSTHRVTRFTRKDHQLFFAGNKRLSSMDILPEVQLLKSDSTTVSISVPAGMPLGCYNLHLVYPGLGMASYPNRLQVAFPRFGKPYKQQ